jgi:hypothetical protein
MGLNFPLSFVSGDDVEFSSVLDDYSALDSDLAFVIVGSVAIAASTVADGKGWVTTIAAEDSAVAAGLYSWSAAVTKDGKKKTVGSGRVTITANLSDLDTLDSRSLNEKILADIQAAIFGLVSLRKGVTQLSMDGRSQSYDLVGLQSLEATYRGLVYNEKRLAAIAAGKGDPSFKRIRFND